MKPLTDEIKFQAFTIDCSDNELVDLLRLIPEDIRYEHRARFEWLIARLEAAAALAAALDAVNELLTNDDVAYIVIEKLGSLQPTIDVALRQYQEATSDN